MPFFRPFSLACILESKLSCLAVFARKRDDFRISALYSGEDGYQKLRRFFN